MRKTLFLILTAVAALLFSPTMHSQTPDFKEPDFAFPQTVETDAQALLKKASAMTGDQAAATRLRAVLEICAARTQIDRNSNFTQPALIADQAKVSEGIGKAMLLTLEAAKFAQIYNDNRWNYERVDAPLEPYPADVSEWSGEQFKTRIKALLAQALDAAKAAPATPLDVFAGSLEYSPEALQYFPDVEGFVRFKTFDILQNIGESTTDAIDSALNNAPAASATFFYWLTAKYDSDPDELTKQYLRYADVEPARIMLARLFRNGYLFLPEVETESDDESRNDKKTESDITNRTIELIRNSLQKFPDWYDNAELKNTLAQIEQPTVNFSYPSKISPGNPIIIKCSYSFVKTVKAELYAVDPDKDYTVARLNGLKPVSTDSCTTENAPGTTGEAELTLRAPAAGYYAVLVSIDGNLPESRQRLPIILATPLTGFTISGCRDNVVVATDFNTGMPVAGVTVKLNSRDYASRLQPVPETVGRTGSDGALISPAPELSTGKYMDRNYVFEYQGLTYDFDNILHVYPYYAEEITETVYEAKLMTDRPLYHPGDSVRWAIAVSRTEPGKDTGPETADGLRLIATFFDANHQPTDTVEVTTDRFGRACGSFATKTDALTGNYSIRILKLDDSGRPTGLAYRSVMVSDFKLPTFEVSIDRVERDVPEPGMVRLHGSARTFTGMAVSGASVKLTLSSAFIWRMFAPQSELAKYNTTTGADGTFTFDLGGEPLEESKNRCFVAAVTVTSAAGETAESSRGFSLGKPYIISVARSPRCADTSAPVEVLFEARNADNGTAPIAINWQLGTLAERADTLTTIVASGSAVAGIPLNLDLSNVAAGKYTFRVEAADSTLAAPATGTDIIIYNERRNLVPDLGSPLFVPESKYVAKGRRSSILVGISGKEKCCVYVAVRSGKELISFSNRKLRPGFHNIDVDTPAGSDNMQVMLVAVRDGKVNHTEISIDFPVAEAPAIIAGSFRDRLTPGLGEQWRFRLADGNGTPLDAAMVATLYNRALDKLTGGSWPAPFSTRGTYGFFQIYAPFAGIYHNSTSVPVDYVEEFDMQWPQFRFINPYELFISNVAYGIQSRPLRSASTQDLNGVVMKSEVRASVATSSAYMAVSAEEAEVAEYDMEYSDDSESGAATEDEGGQSYRVAEQLQIFWEPSLVSDADGNIDLVFTMPDAIGSWQFKAFAWSTDTKSAAYMAECISSKPVMVQPNLPRFLRQGDKARVLANVYNNSDETAAVRTTIELFDLATGAVVKTAESTDSIAAGASVLAAIDIDVPTGAAAIGYRVRAVSGSFSDGEQSAIPVLASSATVVESTQFYLNPDEKSPFSITVPPAADATVTLQYCQNPIWTVVKAMRGLNEPGNMSTVLAGSLFSALAGKHIVDGNPAIAAAIAGWKANPSEEALVSMLAKNEELKKLLLDRTPWVQASKDRTALMSSLCDLLDPENTAKAIEKRTAELLRLQNSDGGFGWASWSNGSSIWATETVLTTIALANSLGMLPADSEIKGMAEAAFDFLQAEAVKPGRPATDRTLALVKALMPSLKVKPDAERIMRATVADIAAKWRRDGTVGKAYDILVLKANGRRALASQLLASIRQHGVVQPGKGLCFPNVTDIRGYATIIQAYAAMDAPAHEIDAMRQWITVYAQANDDLSAYNPDYIIASVLLTGSDWTSVPVAQSVTVDGLPVEISDIESASGYFAQTIAADSTRPTTITVRPNGVTPSYGSVVTVGRRPMASIASKAGDDVSIEKRVLVQRGDQWVETTSFGLGERVRVQLIIKAARDIQYVSIDDERPAAFEPVDQLPGYVYDGGVGFYRENGDAATRLFINRLGKGTYHISYDMTAALAGSFISGIATLQSQYAPEITAHSAAAAITVDTAAE